MARRDALQRLQDTLVARRDELLRRLGGELNGLQYKSADTGDSADQAFDSGNEEVNSQLAELEARELHQIERAIVRLNQGTYGMCEVCHKKIPVARLDALPYTTLCIECQRELEAYRQFNGSQHFADWNKVSDHEAHFEDRREVSLSDLELDMSR